jgi:hypothetical protein
MEQRAVDTPGGSGFFNQKYTRAHLISNCAINLKSVPTARYSSYLFLIHQPNVPIGHDKGCCSLKYMVKAERSLHVP